MFVSCGCLRFLDVLLLMLFSWAFLMSVSSCLLWWWPEVELDFLHILCFWVKFTSDYWLPMCKVIRYHSRPLCRVKGVCFEDDIFSFIEPCFGAYNVVPLLVFAGVSCLRVRFSPLFALLWPLPSPIEISHPKELALKGGQLP